MRICRRRTLRATSKRQGTRRTGHLDITPGMYERRKHPLLPKREFHRRLALHALMGLAVVAGALSVGMIGYHYFENQPWIDSFANASMILSGMGPLGELHTNVGKIFAGCYALFSGLA